SGLLLFFLEQVVGERLWSGHDPRDVGILAFGAVIALALGLFALHALGSLLASSLLPRDLLLPLREGGSSFVRHRQLPRTAGTRSRRRSLSRGLGAGPSAGGAFRASAEARHHRHQLVGLNGLGEV